MIFIVYNLSIFADLFIHEFNVSVMLCIVTETQSTLAHCLPSTGRPKAGVPPGSLAHSPVEWATVFLFRIFEHEYKWSSEVETFWICWAETICMCSEPEPLL